MEFCGIFLIIYIIKPTTNGVKLEKFNSSMTDCFQENESDISSSPPQSPGVISQTVSVTRPFAIL